MKIFAFSLIFVLIIFILKYFVYEKNVNPRPIFVIENEPIYYYDRPYEKYYKRPKMNITDKSRLDHNKTKTFA